MHRFPLHFGRLRRGAAGLALLLVVLPASGCWYYSFTGATLPEHLQTISIPIVEDQSRSSLPNLGDNLSELLIDRFVRRTRLTLEQDETAADAVLTGRIDRYVNEPAVVSGAEQAAVNRVSITVYVRYFDRVENKERLARSFNAFAQYDPVNPEGEIVAARTALEDLTDDIFTAATSDW